jgi:hypothetical protein
MNIKFRRKLKTMFPKKEENFLDTSFNLFVILTIVILSIFLATHLVINAMLTPKGIKLEALNTEKNLLVENNRELSQEIARIKSISIIEEITSEEMNLASNTENHTIYISNESVIAEL